MKKLIIILAVILFTANSGKLYSQDFLSGATQPLPDLSDYAMVSDSSRYLQKEGTQAQSGTLNTNVFSADTARKNYDSTLQIDANNINVNSTTTTNALNITGTAFTMNGLANILYYDGSGNTYLAGLHMRVTPTTVLFGDGVTGQPFMTKSGTVTNTHYGFYNDLNLGMYRIGADNLGFSTSGVKRIDLSDANTEVTNNLLISGKITISGDLPATPTSPGTAGEVRIAENGGTWYLFKCIATDTWVRVELTTW